MDQSKKTVLVYDKIAQEYSERFNTPSSYLGEFSDLLPKNGTILEIACGPGVDANYLHQRGFEVTGIDLSKEMISIAKQKYPDIKFEVADMRELQYDSKSFDAILASCAIIHIPKSDIPALINSFSKYIKKNGYIYFQLQSGDSKEIHINEPFKTDEQIFMNVISLDEITELLTKNNFEIVTKYKRGAIDGLELDFTKLYIIAKNKGNLT